MYEADDESKRDLIDAFHELYEQLESDLNQLTKDPSSARLGSIFRAIHNIKGHAAMLGYNGLVDYTHAMEDVAERLRSKTIEPTQSLCECILLGLDRLKDLHFRDILNHNYPDLNELAIQRGFQSLATSNLSEANKCREELTLLLTGGFSSPAKEQKNMAKKLAGLFRPIPLPSGNDRKLLDLAFFQELSFQLDKKKPHWLNRSILLYDWGQKLNHLAGDMVDYHQLAAATYMHDIGMAFAPQEPSLPTGQHALDNSEDTHHVRWAYDILIRMPGWEEAALIVLGHHERIDGLGYPNNLTSELIHPGSKILAILDSFFENICGHVDSSKRRSILRAMAQINAGKGSQFDHRWIDVFNTMIKDEVRQGRL